jgi:hypothetical protein
MGLAIGDEFPAIFIGIAEDEIDRAVGARSRRFYFATGFKHRPLQQTSSRVAMRRFAASLFTLRVPAPTVFLRRPGATPFPTIDPDRAHWGEKVCILWSQPIRKKKKQYAWPASAHSSRMCECPLLKMKPKRRSKK